MEELKKIIDANESNVRSYCRAFPVVFKKAKGCYLYDEDNHEYLDFFAGAGAINYGHNNDKIKKAIIDYIDSDNIMHGLDMYTEAKALFINEFATQILKPRKLNYKIQFCGSTGTNAVEAAIKLARKNKGRHNIFTFMGAFHGMSLGALSLCSDLASRKGAFVPLNNAIFLPYPVGCGANFDTIEYIENILNDDHSGIEKPAAIILETTQAEGGINVCPTEWLQRLAKLCHDNDILLIVDDIQVGNSRTGYFFSFERAGIVPDMVILSKSISGFGLPMSIVLLKEELDIWKPAEHNGTFRGNQLAFVGAREAIKLNIELNLSNEVQRKGELVKQMFEENILPLDDRLSYRGIGLIWGIDFSNFEDEGLSKKVATKCFEKGLIIERAGRKDCVLKLLPPLVISDEDLIKGINIIKKAIEEVL